MKKRILSSMLLMLLAVTAVQGANRGGGRSASCDQEFKFGVRVGYNGARFLESDTNKESGALLRPKFDLYGEYALSDGVGLNLSLAYSAKGGSAKIEKNSDDALHFYMDYMTLATTFHFYPGEDRQFCLLIGPELAYLVASEVQLCKNGEKEGDAADLLGDKILDEKKPARFDIGITWGLDYEFENGIVLGAIGNAGLLSIVKEQPNVPADQQHGVRNINGGLFLGYNFAKLL